MTADTSTPASAAQLPLWKTILFWLVLLILPAALLEIGARWGLATFAGFDGRHLYQYDFDPYKNILPTRNYVDSRGVRHNGQGFRRDGEVARVKPPKTYRIFLMGGSTAYGLGGLWPHVQREFAVLDNSQTIDAHLERMLGAALPGTRFEVINAAITSTWTHHHLIYLNQTILGFDPDMVLFLDGYNDFYFFEEPHDQFASYSYSHPSHVILGEPTLYALAYANGWWLFRRSAAVHLAARGARTLKHVIVSGIWGQPTRPIDVDNAVAVLQRIFPKNALKMQERIGLILRNEGVHAVFMLQPMLILERGKPMPDMERRLFEFNVYSYRYRPNYEAFIHRAVGFVRQQEADMARRVGAEYIDLTGIYRAVNAQVYTDYAHLTPMGNELLARHVLERILPTIRQDLGLPPGEARGSTGGPESVAPGTLRGYGDAHPAAHSH